MSTFCNLDEAFLGPIVVPGSSKKKKRRDGGGGVGIEHFVPAPLSSTPAATAAREEETEAADDILQGPPPATKKLQAGGGSSELDSFFPLPGETAEPEEWQKAFVLQPSQIPQPLQQQLQRRPLLTNGAVAVNGQSTLWRQIPEPVPANQPVVAAPVPSEINKRLDALTRQLESLTTPTPLQSTAELFLFVAIGLLILLAIDSLLRFASGSMRSGRVGRVVVGGGGRGWRGHNRW